MSAIFGPSTAAPAPATATAKTTAAVQQTSAASSQLKTVLISVGAQFAFIAFLVILAGDFPEPVAAFVALLWIMFLINKAGGFNGLSGLTSGTTGTGSNLAPGAFLSD